MDSVKISVLDTDVELVNFCINEVMSDERITILNTEKTLPSFTDYKLLVRDVSVLYELGQHVGIEKSKRMVINTLYAKS